MNAFGTDPGAPAPAAVPQLWPWLRAPRRAPGWQLAAAVVLLGFAAVVHVDLFLRTVRFQTGLSIALGFNLTVFAIAIALIAARAGEFGWILGVGSASGAATAWLATELFPQLAFMDPEGQSWTGNPVLHLLTLHLTGTGNTTFCAEIVYLLLWAATTRSAPPIIDVLRRFVYLLCAVLVAGFLVVLVLGSGAGERYGNTG